MTSIKSSKQGFTIIELLTVMSIIIILIGILVPALNRVRIYSKTVAQKGQFHEISKGLEMYRNEHGDTYPDSGPTSASTATGGTTGYCGAMKMCEAMVGQDGMGFHPSSRFVADGTILVNGEPCDLYPLDLCEQRPPTDYRTNMRERTKYMDTEHVKAVRLQDLYTWAVSGGTSHALSGNIPFEADPVVYSNAVITDVFLRANIKISCSGQIGQKAGMPVLYYKADPSKLSHDVNNPTSLDNIYNFDDNYAITMLGCPWESLMATNPHPMYSDLRVFYRAITNTRITSTPKPHNEDGYILIAAGWDGLYGTRDDVFNFTE